MANDVIDYKYSVVDSFPHAVDLFTQGLEFANGLLYESGGGYGNSRVLKRTLDSVRPIRVTESPADVFAEGITLVGDTLVQLTWRSQRGFLYDPATLALDGEFRFSGEGWGLTNDGVYLIASNGSSILTFLDPQDFSIVRQQTVTLGGKPLNLLNELEWINGLVYANVWRTDWIVMIDPDSGEVVGRVGLQNLLPDAMRRSETGVLNGIAYDREQHRLLVTGKNWPRIFQIELRH